MISLPPHKGTTKTGKSYAASSLQLPKHTPTTGENKPPEQSTALISPVSQHISCIISEIEDVNASTPQTIQNSFPLAASHRTQTHRHTHSAHRVHVHRHVGLRGRLVVWHRAGVHRGRGLDQTRLLAYGERRHEQMQMKHVI